MIISTANRTFQLLKNICDTRSTTEGFLPPSAEKGSLPLRPAQQPFPRAVPESEGISSDHIRRFLEEMGRGSDLCTQNVLILRNGKVLCAASYGAQTLNAPKHTFSACKSITSLAVGLLIDDGLLRLEDKASDLFADLMPPAATRRLKELTVEDLLTMRSGILFAEPQSATESEWIHGILGDTPITEPGTTFHYNSLNTHLLAAIVTRISGERLTDFLEKRLFIPMGITDILWECSPEGIEKGGWGLYIRPEDMAKLGQLVLNHGVWKGEQLISSAYLTAATTAHAVPPPETGNFDYGYQIWVSRRENAFLFNGMLGQNVLGYRDSGILVVTNAGADTEYQEGRFFEIVDRYFGGTFPDSLPEDTEAYRRLETCISDLSYYNRESLPIREKDERFLDRSFTADDPRAPSTGLLPVLLQILHNNYTAGITSIALGRRGNLPELIYREQDAVYRLPIGLGAPYISELSFRGNCFRIAAHGRFTHDEEERPVFYIRLDFLETPSVRILKLILTDEGLLLRQSETPGLAFLYNKLQAAAHQPLLKPLLLIAAGSGEEDFLLYKARQIMAPEIRLKSES